jgi:DNA-binding transcriptional regulator WhiA
MALEKQLGTMNKIIREYNKNYFSKITEKSAYWGGFLAADGSISDRNHSVSLTLAQKDLKHLEAFKNEIKYSGNLLFCPKTNSNRINLYSAHKMIYDLENIYNITANKSLNLKCPEGIVCESDQVIKSYIVGYIDGDGCIKYCKRDNLYILDVFSGSLKIIKWIKNELERIYNLKPRKIYSYKNGHTYRISGKVLLSIIDDLKELPIPKLERKWNLKKGNI